MMNNHILALCATILSAVLSMGLMLTGGPTVQVVVIFALALATTAQYIAQDDRAAIQEAASMMMLVALFFMWIGVIAHILVTVFS